MQNQARNLGQWPSRAALIADSAVAAALSDWTDRRAHLSVLWWSELVAGLRVFLEDCPTGEGGVSVDEETVESRCREHTVLTLNPEESGERLLEVPAPEGYTPGAAWERPASSLPRPCRPRQTIRENGQFWG